MNAAQARALAALEAWNREMDAAGILACPECGDRHTSGRAVCPACEAAAERPATRLVMLTALAMTL